MLKSGGSADPPNSGPEEDMAFSGDAGRGFREAVWKTDSGSRGQSSVTYHSCIHVTLGKLHPSCASVSSSIKGGIVVHTLQGCCGDQTSTESI